MNSDVSYHRWCWQHLIPLLSTFVFDRPLTSYSQLYNEGVGTKLSSFQQIWEDPTVTRWNILSWGSWWKLLKNLVWMWPLDYNTYTFTKLENIHVRIWVFKLGVHVSLLEVVKVHWPDDGCLAYWTWVPFLELVCYGMLPRLLKIA